MNDYLDRVRGAGGDVHLRLLTASRRLAPLWGWRMRYVREAISDVMHVLLVIP